MIITLNATHDHGCTMVSQWYPYRKCVLLQNSIHQTGRCFWFPSASSVPPWVTNSMLGSVTVAATMPPFRDHDNLLATMAMPLPSFCLRRATCCPACRTSLIATRFWVVVICPIIKCLPVLEFSFILFDLCLFITIFNFILNYVPIVTFWIFTYHKIWILLIIFCFILNYWIIYFLTCLEVFWSDVS